MKDIALNIYKDSIIWDNSIVWAEMIPNKLESLERVRISGVTLASIKINARVLGFRSNLICLMETLKHFEAEDDKYILVKNYDDILRAKKENKLGLTFSLADAGMIENPETDVEIFKRFGVTHILLSAGRNTYGDSCYEYTNTGLSIAGRKFVKMMNSEKILLDGTLGSYKTTMEAMELSEKPFIFSHVNPFSICKNTRNIKDDQIKACAKTGGVIGLTFLGGYIGNPKPSAIEMFGMIDYICELVGSEHVGFGSNYTVSPEAFFNKLDGAAEGGYINDEYKNCGGACFEHSEITKLINIMIEKKYKEEDIKNILGMNWRRVYEVLI